MSEVHSGIKLNWFSRISSVFAELLILVVCAAFYSQVGLSTSPVYDPIGPDKLPMILIILISGLALLEIIRKMATGVLAKQGDEGTGKSRVSSVAMFVVGTCAYVAALALVDIPYFVSTAGFFTLSSVIISERTTLREFLATLGVGIAFGYGLQVIFTQVVVVDLPV